MKQIAVIGLGYIGLPTAILAAESGCQVLGFDVNETKIKKIQSGDPTILEPQVKEKLFSVLQSKKFRATNKLESSDCFIVAVPTPFKEGKKADLKYLFDAAKSIASVLKNGDLVILESTIPVGTTEDVCNFIENATGLLGGTDFFISHCPERVLPGKIFEELVKNDRVIGGIDQKSCEKSKDFYSKFVKGNIYFTDDKTAEMVKLVENSSRDVSIAFANQVASMSKAVGIDPYKVISLANRHPRVNILNPSCGVGGHCIAVDPWFLVESFPKESKLLRLAREINDLRPAEVLQEIDFFVKDICDDKNVDKVNVLVLGLTFKPDVDDLRESPALKIALSLKDREDLNLFVCEPNISDQNFVDLGFENVDLFAGLEVADIVVCLVLHKSFKLIPKVVLKDKKLVDSCGLIFNLDRERI